MNEHACIKCGTKYQDVDVDAYLCATCLKEKQIIASTIDRKFGSTVGQQPSGELQAYDAMARTQTSPDGRITRSFAPAKL